MEHDGKREKVAEPVKPTTPPAETPKPTETVVFQQTTELATAPSVIPKDSVDTAAAGIRKMDINDSVVYPKLDIVEPSPTEVSLY